MPEFELFHEKFGAGVCHERPDDDTLTRLSTALPPELISEWRQSGLCSYADGLLWFVNPERFSASIAEWLGKERSMLAFARTSFGNLFLCDSNGTAHRLDVHYGTLREIGPLRIVVECSFTEDDYLAHVINRSLHKRCTKRLGEPEPDEMFTFEPALVLGGSEEAKNARKVAIFPQLSILAQLHGGIAETQS